MQKGMATVHSAIIVKILSGRQVTGLLLFLVESQPIIVVRLRLHHFKHRGMYTAVYG